VRIRVLHQLFSVVQLLVLQLLLLLLLLLNFVVSRLDEWLLAEIVAVAMTPLMLVRVGMGRTMGQWMGAFWRRLLIRLLCWLWVGIVVGALQMLTFVQLAVSLVGGILKVYIYVSCINSELIV